MFGDDYFAQSESIKCWDTPEIKKVLLLTIFKEVHANRASIKKDLMLSRFIGHKRKNHVLNTNKFNISGTTLAYSLKERMLYMIVLTLYTEYRELKHTLQLDVIKFKSVGTKYFSERLPGSINLDLKKKCHAPS